jgi:hypothetical protein
MFNAQLQAMTIRTSSTTVTFRRPFCLGGYDKTLPAGTYDVETDEELLEGISFPVYRRIATLLRQHATPADRGRTRTFTVDPRELDLALERDKTGVQDMQPDSPLSRRDVSPGTVEEIEMAEYGITRVLVEEFRFRGFRYANLRDAIAQAKRQQRLG